MRLFVPVPDDWDGGPDFAGETPVPYRVGLPVWREDDAAASGRTESPEPAISVPRAA